MIPLFWTELLTRALRDDRVDQDWTSRAIESPKAKRAKAKIVAKEDGVWACSGLLAAANSLNEFEVSLKSNTKDGSSFKKGSQLVRLEGGARDLLALERSILNLAAYTCGIATQTYRLISIVNKRKSLRTKPRIVSTRKILPGFHELAIHAVECGGGFCHRADLAGGILIKENHIRAAGGIAHAVKLCRKKSPHLLKIEVEVENFKQIEEALEAQVDVIMLDNFKPEQIKRATSLIKSKDPRCLIEVSGGISEKNLSKFLIEGVDILSVGSLTHSVRSLDLSMQFEER
ncbi:MAG: nicotinate-nucleotide diphosphorylase (carboxylating) [Deltaproteobacteria bacterium CG11_big_fil_rev_8_21_14_0_20_45_16]|nr:MAG: nicotinate-nucleotide diphosphorylase (carboxylating) [Deltaproteobacteria bacterium CG11_big_fil_rev_8_21_14_0_20_45_16]